MSERISKRLRQQIERRARRRCEYCLSPLAFATESFAVEHIIPSARGGITAPENLALACSGCNSHKYDKIAALDPDSQASFHCIIHASIDGGTISSGMYNTRVLSV